jgi:hypothetical protein
MRTKLPDCEHWETATDDVGAYVHTRAWEVLDGVGAVVVSSVQGFTPWDPSAPAVFRVELPPDELTQAKALEVHDAIGQAVQGPTAHARGIDPQPCEPPQGALRSAVHSPRTVDGSLGASRPAGHPGVGCERRGVGRWGAPPVPP